MPDELLKTVLLPLALIVIMFGMGMTLTLADFVRVVTAPKAKVVGLVNQLILLPVLGFAIAVGFRLPPEYAVGLMLVAACPGGPTSNVITHLSRGDTALSVSLTAVSSLVTVFTIPVVVGWSMTHFLGEGREIALPFGKTLVQLVVVTILPVAAGMLLRARRPGWADRLGKPVNVASIAFLALVIVLAVLKEDDLGRQFREAGPAAIALNLATMAVGFGTAALFGLATPQRITIAVECGIQNGTLGLAIALGILGSPAIAVPAIVYSLFMFASGGAVIAARSLLSRAG